MQVVSQDLPVTRVGDPAWGHLYWRDASCYARRPTDQTGNGTDCGTARGTLTREHGYDAGENAEACQHQAAISSDGGALENER